MRSLLARMFTGLLVTGVVTSVAVSSALAAPTTLKVGAGVGSGTTSGDVYAPGDVSVHLGDSVSWTINSDEPHSITRGQGPAGAPPPAWPVTGFAAAPAGPPTAFNAGSVDDNGSGFINTGLIFKGSTATVHFTKLGDFNFYCIIHPGMAGVVHVVADSAATTSQADADAKAAATQSQLLAQVDPLNKQTQGMVTSQKRANGTTLWNIFTNGLNKVGPVAGGGTGYLELLQFTPPNLTIGAGDTVHWTATAPHTVTFMPPGQDYHSLGDPLEVKAAKPSASYDGKSLYNSGIFLFGPSAPSSFDLTFPKAGDYKYVCLLHADQGQVGTIHVNASAVVPTALPSTGGIPPMLLLVVAGIGVALVLSGTVSLRSSRSQ